MSPSASISWEYLTVPERERHRLTALGEEGWELVGLGGDDDRLLYLKRPGGGFRERVTLEQRTRYYDSRGLDPHDHATRGLA